MLPVLRNNKFSNLVFSSKVFNWSILDCAWSNKELKNLVTNCRVRGGCTSLELLNHNVLQTCCKSMVISRGVARTWLNRRKLYNFSFLFSPVLHILLFNNRQKLSPECVHLIWHICRSVESLKRYFSSCNDGDSNLSVLIFPTVPLFRKPVPFNTTSWSCGGSWGFCLPPKATCTIWPWTPLRWVTVTSCTPCAGLPACRSRPTSRGSRFSLSSVGVGVVTVTVLVPPCWLHVGFVLREFVPVFSKLVNCRALFKCDRSGFWHL